MANESLQLRQPQSHTWTQLGVRLGNGLLHGPGRYGRRHTYLCSFSPDLWTLVGDVGRESMLETTGAVTFLSERDAKHRR